MADDKRLEKQLEQIFSDITTRLSESVTPEEPQEFFDNHLEGLFSDEVASLQARVPSQPPPDRPPQTKPINARQLITQKVKKSSPQSPADLPKPASQSPIPKVQPRQPESLPAQEKTPLPRENAARPYGEAARPYGEAARPQGEAGSTGALSPTTKVRPVQPQKTLKPSPPIKPPSRPVTPTPAAAKPHLEPTSGPRPSEWANDPMLRMAADDDPQVARLALETLTKMGEVVRRRVLRLAQQPTAPLHDGVIAYLSYLLKQPVVYISPGVFLMGSNAEADRLAETEEQPQHEVNLPGYWLARYPVTVAGYRDFIQKSGFRPSSNEGLEAPDDHPVVGVTWHDSVAYCRWLGERTGLPITLPSEAEWEKAARGPEGRRYPWGDYPPTVSLCNFDRTPVGFYSPQGDSIYGCADMAGNVWEWTRSAYRSYPYQPDDGRETLDSPQARAIRGLTFNDLSRFTRCAARYQLKENLRLLTLGFRITVSPPLKG